MECEFLNREHIDLNQWNELLINSNTASFFQSPQCYEFYSSLSFMTAFVYGVEKNGELKGVIVGYLQKDGGIIKEFFSRRAIIIGGPLLANDITVESLSLLLNNTVKALKQKSIYIETRNFNDYSKHKNVFEESGFEYIPHLNFHIDTVSINVVNSSLGKSHKRNIKTSYRDGATIVDNPTIEQVSSMYHILKKLYKTRVKTPLLPFEFFEKLFKLNCSKFLLVELNGEIIGGTACTCLQGVGVYEWFACGKNGVYKNIYPSTLATYAGIEYATKGNYNIYDMMGAGKPDKDYGVRDFKAKFGGKLVEYGRFICVTQPLLYSIGKLGVKLLKKI